MDITQMSVCLRTFADKCPQAWTNVHKTVEKCPQDCGQMSARLRTNVRIYPHSKCRRPQYFSVEIYGVLEHDVQWTSAGAEISPHNSMRTNFPHSEVHRTCVPILRRCPQKEIAEVRTFGLRTNAHIADIVGTGYFITLESLYWQKRPGGDFT